MTNRLNLDFSLTTNEDRVAFLEEYLQRPEFVKRPPTSDELETMSNYLLWGKDPESGLNAKQEGVCDIETKHGTWDKTANIESLDGLLEQPTFNEATLMPLDAVPTKVKREVFSRSEALAKCPDYLRETLTTLFHNIDELDLAINYYDLAHNKRKNPPREQLLAKFSAKEQAELVERVSHWNQYKYLKMRHQLVELRREQYTLRDSFAPVIFTESSPSPVIYRDPQIDTDIEVLPLGTKCNSPVRRWIFRKWEEVIPTNFTEEMLEEVSTYYWKKKNFKPAPA